MLPPTSPTWTNKLGGRHLAILVVCAFIAVGLVSGSEDAKKRAECLLWARLENKTLPLQNEGHARCITNEECTGFICDGVYKGNKIKFGMRVIPCQTPPGVEVFGYAPQYNVKNFSHVFYHKAEYEVPGALLNLSMLPQGGVMPEAGSLIKGRLEIHLKMNHERNTLILGLTAKACIGPTCITSKPLFNDTEIPVPDCPNAIPTSAKQAKVYSHCLVSDISPCGANQVCEQAEAGSDYGTCACLHGYSLQDDMTCASIVDLEAFDSNDQMEVNRPKKSTKAVESQLPVAAGDGSTQRRVRETSRGATIAAIVVSLIVVLVVVGAVFAVTTKTRIGTRFRARMTRTPYGDMVIGDRGQITGSTTTLE